MSTILCIVLVSVILAAPGDAHLDDRLFPVYEIPTSLLPDVHDGSLEDWQAAVPGASMATDDFLSDPDIGKGDPIDLDDLAYQIFLGWHSPTGRLYFAMERLDDVYINDYEGGNPRVIWRHDGLEFMIDGDHSGGPYGEFAENADRLTSAQAQQYLALPQSPDGQALWLWQGPDRSGPEHDWMVQPPVGDAGGAVLAGSPTQSLFELYLTPFDDLVAEPAQSIPSLLAAGRIIGLQIAIPDFDSAPGEYDGFHTLTGVGGSWRDASLFVDAQLIGCDLPDCGAPRQVVSAVRADSWGRIKASLNNDEEGR